MIWTSEFVKRHPGLFVFLPAKDVHPHDYFMARTVLRFIPRTVTPNKVTLFRILATPFVFFLILSQRYLLGTILFLFTAFTDVIDGSLARTRNQITTFGILVDPLADKLLIGSMVIVLMLRYFPARLAVAVLGIEILLMGTALLAKYRFKTIRMANVWGKAKMMLQVVAVFLILLGLLLDFPHLLTVAFWLFGVAVGFAIVSLFAHGV